MVVAEILSVALLLALLRLFFDTRNKIDAAGTAAFTDFGQPRPAPGQNAPAKKAPNKAILTQMIRQQNIAFYAYLVSLAICFLLGVFAVYKIINKELDWKLLVDAFSISGGIASTVSFRRLYNRCTDEMNKMSK